MSMQYYVGTKIVVAEPEEKDGRAGYKVFYPDGYVSWSPATTFDKANLPMGHLTDKPEWFRELVGQLTVCTRQSSDLYNYIHGEVARIPIEFEKPYRDLTEADQQLFQQQLLVQEQFLVILKLRVTLAAKQF